MVDLHCIELPLLWLKLNEPWWACGSCACSGLCSGKCDDRLCASHWWHLCSGDMCNLTWSMIFCPVDETHWLAHDEEPVEAELCIGWRQLLSLDKELGVPFFWICRWHDCYEICHSKTEPILHLLWRISVWGSTGTVVTHCSSRKWHHCIWMLVVD